MSEEYKPTKTSRDNFGLEPKVAGVLTYLFTIIGGLIFYLNSKDPYVKFHSMQSIILSIAYFILTIVVYLFSLFFTPFLFLSWLVNIGMLVLWILLMIKAYNGEQYKLPVIGDLAEKYAK